MDVICEEFTTRVDVKDPKSLRRFFLRYSFFTTNDLALILKLNPRTIRTYKGRAGIKRKGGPKTKPENPQIPVHLDLPENWDTAEWWQAHYPRYGMRILTRETGLNYITVRSRVRRHCGGIRSHREATTSAHPCCTREWLQEHYIEQRLSQKQCGRVAGVSDSTIRDWLVHHGIQVRGQHASSLLDQISSI